jgi:pyruvate, orthophosphate dikinase
MEESCPRIVFFLPGLNGNLAAECYGNKAAGLSEMASAGIPVPPGFVLPVRICEEYYLNGKRLPQDVPELLSQGISFLEKSTGYVFGGMRNPLLVSVRSGAPVSMPGIMDTILNVGLTPVTVRALLAQTGNPRFVYDTYRRFLENFGTSILNHPRKTYTQNLKDLMHSEGITDERELDYHSLRSLCQGYEQVYTSKEHQAFLTDTRKQLAECTTAVLRSFTGPRASAFFKSGVSGSVSGTAVTVQVMVFGNMGASSGAGVAFTRNPWTGSKNVLIDFRFGAQGEDVVSGDRGAIMQDELAQVMPDVYSDLVQMCQRLEAHFGDMQDIEFTVQEGKLYLLQTRSGKRSPYAALHIAVDLFDEGILSEQKALALLKNIDLDAIEIQAISSQQQPIGQGISASGGVAQGMVAFTPKRAESDAKSGPVILVRETASPDDIIGIDVASGILTALGARTSHAAVVARQLGKVCVVNCTGLVIEAQRHRCTIGGTLVREGDIISIDGNTGSVYRGRVNVVSWRPADLIARVRQWETRAS